MLNVTDLCVEYGKKQILKDVNFSLEQGTVTALLGANGCGKTTLLKALCGIVPSQGDCVLDGVSLKALSAAAIGKKVSYIPQRSGLSLALTAQEVAEMGFNPWLPLLAGPTRTMKQKAADTLHRVGIEPEADYLSLSEGQKQLCILARAMVTEGSLLLMDEPESALDLSNRYEIFRLLRSTMGDKTILTALHDPQLALQTADRVILLKDGTVDSILQPKKDDLSHMEQALCRIYGQVRLYKIEDHTVMVKP